MAAAARFLGAPRTNEELYGLGATVRMQDRENLTVREREKHHEYAISALPTKFALLSLSAEKEQLQNTYNVMMRTQELFQRLDKYDMANVFAEIVTPDTANPGQITADVKNLRVNALGATETEVRASNRFYNRFGQPYDIQNLVWSQELLENSCESELRDKVMESLLLVPEDERGGPLYFRVMMGLITSSTAEATRAMITRITTLKIRDIQGEDIDKAVSTIRVI
jgi:hypothetical protein